MPLKRLNEDNNSLKALKPKTLTDSIKLRPLTAAEKDDFLFLSSEEAAIRLVSPMLDRVWSPRGGVPVIGRLESLNAMEAKA